MNGRDSSAAARVLLGTLGLACATYCASSEAAPRAVSQRSSSAVQESISSAELELTYQKARQQAHESLVVAMETCEAVIKQHAHDERLARFYLLLGQLKLAYERASNKWPRSYDESVRQRAQMEDYATKHPDEYEYTEIAGDYLYNGHHFRELIKRFPNSEFVDDAAYELTDLTLTHVSDCEGWIPCDVDSQFEPVQDFLRNYPNSPYAEEAVERANKAFQSTLGESTWRTPWEEIKDPNTAVEGYDPEPIKKKLATYEEIAASLPPHLCAKAYETIAYYWGRFGEYGRAKALY